MHLTTQQIKTRRFATNKYQLHQLSLSQQSQQNYTVNHKKTCHFVFDYNSSITCSIFIIFLPVETGRNTVQLSYLMAWWRHNSVTMHVTKVYYIQLVIKIKYVEFEELNIFFIKTWECESFTARRLIKEVPTKKLSNTNIGRLSARVVNNWFDRTQYCIMSAVYCIMYMYFCYFFIFYIYFLLVCSMYFVYDIIINKKINCDDWLQNVLFIRGFSFTR